jgi:alpha-D-ribose 1-methylphosphonate 5-triphosphate diphosphatase PhnM
VGLNLFLQAKSKDRSLRQLKDLARPHYWRHTRSMVMDHSPGQRQIVQGSRYRECFMATGLSDRDKKTNRWSSK